METFKIWKTLTIDQYEDSVAILNNLASRGIKVGDWAKQSLKRSSSRFVHYPKTLQLVTITVAELGHSNGVLTSDLYASALSKGLTLCEPHMAPYIRLAYLEQPAMESLYVAMNSITGDENFDSRYRIVNAVDKDLWLTGDHRHLDDRWLATDLLVFEL